MNFAATVWQNDLWDPCNCFNMLPEAKTNDFADVFYLFRNNARPVKTDDFVQLYARMSFRLCQTSPMRPELPKKRPWNNDFAKSVCLYYLWTLLKPPSAFDQLISLLQMIFPIHKHWFRCIRLPKSRFGPYWSHHLHFKPLILIQLWADMSFGRQVRAPHCFQRAPNPG